MRLTIVSATGGVGRALMNQAVAAGHDVTAVVRDPGKVTAAVRVVQADLSAPTPQLEAAVGSADAVLSGLGPRTRADAGVASRGTRVVIRALQATGARRLVVVSAAPITAFATPGRPHPPRHDPGDGPATRYLLAPLIRRILREYYADLALMEEELRDSGLDWTSVRPPRLTDGPLTGTYRTALDQNVRGGLSMSRADVAHLMLATVTDQATVGHTVGCGY
ncbi:NAD(P)H-binding protein [Kineosporia sp. NBRC 101731]|uniref:NAD(P)-dependent oxidoreductase n=1 Tax=Kineosporia sp. NBRC 101731 TaxID=3032199 RepID=UPI0024A02C3F|nr:NAD(P)H-binding protein [Kineosporia sp. NBRC 101731]GLY30366.1 NADH-flavin reductase [Kineosporia sp. NBRC 101731]